MTTSHRYSAALVNGQACLLKDGVVITWRMTLREAQVDADALNNAWWNI